MIIQDPLNLRWNVLTTSPALMASSSEQILQGTGNPSYCTTSQNRLPAEHDSVLSIRSTMWQTMNVFSSTWHLHWTYYWLFPNYLTTQIFTQVFSKWRKKIQYAFKRSKRIIYMSNLQKTRVLILFRLVSMRPLMSEKFLPLFCGKGIPQNFPRWYIRRHIGTKG